MESLTYNDILEAIYSLPVDDQEIIADTIRKRIIEARRDEIARNAFEARKLFFENKLPSGTVEDLERDLTGE